MKKEGQMNHGSGEEAYVQHGMMPKCGGEERGQLENVSIFMLPF